MSSADWVDGVRIPKNYRVVRSERVAAGVWRLELSRRDPEQVVNIARLERSSPNQLRVLLSNGYVAGPTPRTERTSKMCRRADCLLAVNGDYFADGMPVGGLVSGGEPWRSPADGRRQFSLRSDESATIGTMTMTAALTATYHRVPAGGLHLLGGGGGATDERRTTTFSGVNVPGTPNSIVAYTPRWGTSTGTDDAFEIAARIVSPEGPIEMAVDTVIELASSKRGKIPEDGLVLSGRGAGADQLISLWNDVSAGRADRRASLRVVASPDPEQSVGGKELLVHKGEVAYTARSSRAPRTMIGWNAAGDILLVTVDGRQPGRATGMTLVEAADLMRRLGAVEALNLDGGGSTTFVKKGRVVNRPSNSGRHERSVAVAVAIVPA